MRVKFLKALSIAVLSAGLAAGLAGAAEAPAEVQIAAGDACQKRCQAAENQCRMASKDLDSSACSAKFIACIQNCRR